MMDMRRAHAREEKQGNDASRPPAGEFVCTGCGHTLQVALGSAMCFAEAQVLCPGCERDYQERRGRWAPAETL